LIRFLFHYFLKFFALSQMFLFSTNIDDAIVDVIRNDDPCIRWSRRTVQTKITTWCCIGCRLRKFWIEIFLYYYVSSFHSYHTYIFHWCASLSCFVAPTHTYTDMWFIGKRKGWEINRKFTMYTARYTKQNTILCWFEINYLISLLVIVLFIFFFTFCPTHQHKDIRFIVK